MFALVTGGGTGGHVYPALALAEALVDRGHERATIRFVGSSRGLEARAVPAAGFAIDLLPGRGLERRLSARSLSVVGQTAVALVRAMVLVRRLRPAVVVGVGGYAALPTTVAARAWRIPVVIHEQNAAPGLANRIAVRLGAVPAISLPGTPLSGAVLTGNPVRRQVTQVTRRPSLERPLLAIFGGSLGARRLNEAALELYDRWRHRSDVAVHHVTGPAGHERSSARLAALRSPDDALEYRLVRYEERMDELYARASLAACRSGAVTVAELAAAGVPSVLVPLPGAPGDHQTHNAAALVEAGGGVLVPDGEMDGERLDMVAGDLLARPRILASMGEAARRLARPDAASDLAALIERVASRG